MAALQMCTRCLPESGLHIVDESFVRVHVNLLGKPERNLSEITEAYGHPVILPQCGEFLRDNTSRHATSSDNARAAREVAEGDDMTVGALASELAAEIYGLKVLARHIEDSDRNTTRFLIMAREPDLHATRRTRHDDQLCLPRAQHSRRPLQGDGRLCDQRREHDQAGKLHGRRAFTATQFYAEIEGHPDDTNVQLALEELGYFTDHLHLMGVYPADPRRLER